MKKRNKSMVGMIAVLMILIVMFTQLVDALREERPPGAPPPAEAAAAPASPAAPGQPENQKLKVTVTTTPVGGTATSKNLIFENQAELTKYKAEHPASTTVNYADPKPIFETPFGDFEPNTAMPDAPEFVMETTGQFKTGVGANPQYLIPTGDSSYQIVDLDHHLIAEGTKMLLIDPVTGLQQKVGDQLVFAMQQTDAKTKAVSFRFGGTPATYKTDGTTIDTSAKPITTPPISLDNYNKLIGDKGLRITGIGENAIETTGGRITITEQPLKGYGKANAASGDQAGNDLDKRAGEIRVRDITYTPTGSTTTGSSTAATTIKEIDIPSVNMQGEVVTVKDATGQDVSQIQLKMPDGKKLTLDASITTGTDGIPVLKRNPQSSAATTAAPASPPPESNLLEDIPATMEGNANGYTSSFDSATGRLTVQTSGAAARREQRRVAAETAAAVADNADKKYEGLKKQYDLPKLQKTSTDARAAADKALLAANIPKSKFGIDVLDSPQFIALPANNQKDIREAVQKANDAEQAYDTADDAFSSAAVEKGKAITRSQDAKKTFESSILPDERTVFTSSKIETARFSSDKDGKVVDFQEMTITDRKGVLLEKYERTADTSGKLGFLGDWGRQEGNRLQRTIYTYDENGKPKETFTQLSGTFDVNKDKDDNKINRISSQTNLDTLLGTFKTGNMPLTTTDAKDTYNMKLKIYGPGFDPQNPGNAQPISEKPVSTSLGFQGLLGGYSPEIEAMDEGPEKEAAKAQNKIDLDNDRVARFASAQDYASSFGQLSSLFADNGAFSAWSRRTDKYFNNVIMGGSEFRVSRICELKHHYLRKVSDNVLLVQTPGGQFVTAAFVNGERQIFKNPIDNSVQYLYKISYKVNIPESLIDTADVRQITVIRASDDPKPTPEAQFVGKTGTGDYIYRFLAEGPFFNVVLSGNSPGKCLFIDTGNKECLPESVKKGANAIQRNMFVQYSKNDYTRVCIEFTKSFEFSNRNANKICADIVDVNQQARDVVAVPDLSAGGGTAAPGSTTTVSGTTASGTMGFTTLDG